MGNCISEKKVVKQKKIAKTIGNNFETKEALNQALRENGLERCNLLFAIDFTKSNIWQGEKTFDGKNLHTLKETKQQSPPARPPPYNEEDQYEPNKQQIVRLNSIGRSLTFGNLTRQQTLDNLKLMSELNPYQWVLSVSGTQLDDFDDDKLIPTAIFGHARAKNDPYVKEIYDRYDDARGCHSIDGVIEAYEKAVNSNELSGGTLFAPVIEWALKYVENEYSPKAHDRREYSYHILIIIGDGCIDDLKETKEVLKKASKFPLSVVFVGVGDSSNPKDSKDKWRDMKSLDDEPTGEVDNWQSVYLSNMKERLEKVTRPDLELATWMFMEVPEQYKFFKKNGLVKG